MQVSGLNNKESDSPRSPAEGGGWVLAHKHRISSTSDLQNCPPFLKQRFLLQFPVEIHLHPAHAEAWHGEAKPDNSTLPLLAELVSLYDEEGEIPVNLQHRLLPELRLFVWRQLDGWVGLLVPVTVWWRHCLSDDVTMQASATPPPSAGTCWARRGAPAPRASAPAASSSQTGWTGWRSWRGKSPICRTQTTPGTTTHHSGRRWTSGPWVRKYGR